MAWVEKLENDKRPTGQKQLLTEEHAERVVRMGYHRHCKPDEPKYSRANPEPVVETEEGFVKINTIDMNVKQIRLVVPEIGKEGNLETSIATLEDAMEHETTNKCRKTVLELMENRINELKKQL